MRQTRDHHPFETSHRTVYEEQSPSAVETRLQENQSTLHEDAASPPRESPQFQAGLASAQEGWEELPTSSARGHHYLRLHSLIARPWNSASILIPS